MISFNKLSTETNNHFIRPFIVTIAIRNVSNQYLLIRYWSSLVVKYGISIPGKGCVS